MLPWCTQVVPGPAPRRGAWWCPSVTYRDVRGGVSHGEIRRLRKPTSLRCTGRKTSALRCPLHFYLTLLCHLVELRAVLARIMPPRRPSYVPSFVQDCPHPKYSPHASRHRGELSSTAIPARFHPPRL